MSIQKMKLRNSLLVLCVLVAGSLRLLGASSVFIPLTNFTPICAMALFGGTYFSNRIHSFLFPLLALLLSDLLLMQVFYPGMRSGLLYSGWGWTYGAFLLMIGMGSLIKKVTLKNMVIAAVSAALVHWILTDFGVWISGGLDVSTGKTLAPNLQGWIQCNLQALPFLKNMIMSNLVYCSLMFGGFEYAQRRFKNLQVSKIPQPSIV
ncbi:MAG: hypothetical protein KGO92_15340 [Bacteroidota bacterium]|nr:hypothetical protein [Bacteroidota bacterium]